MSQGTRYELQALYECTNCKNPVELKGNQITAPTGCCNCGGLIFKLLWQHKIQTQTTITPIEVEK